VAAAVAAALITLLVLPNAGVLANQFLSLFQVKQFQPVSVNPQDLNNSFLRDLQSFGKINYQASNDTGRILQNQTEAQVRSAVHFSLLLPDHLPTGVSTTPQFVLFQGGQASFTFDAAKVRAYLTQKGYNNVTIPVNLNGSTYSITMATGAIATYPAVGCQGQVASDKARSAACAFSTVVAEIPSPVIRASSSSASLKDLRDFFLSLPGQANDVRTLIQQVDVTNGVVPLPIPPQVHAQQVTTHGTSGVLLTEQSLKVGAVLWQAQGIIYLVATQTGDSTALLATTNSLR
jgi:hypothetical protein